jgi:archaellum component FlaC
MANSDREEAEKIKDFIADLDKHINAMGNKRELDDIYEDTKELRSKLKSSLEYLRTDIRDLRRIYETDIY